MPPIAVRLAVSAVVVGSRKRVSEDKVLEISVGKKKSATPTFGGDYSEMVWDIFCK